MQQCIDAKKTMFNRFSVSRECVESFESIIAGRIEMDALRLSYMTNRDHNLASLHPPLRDLGKHLQAAFRHWRKSAISTATYLIVIASVALYDILLTIQYWESLKQLEENPVGRWLMNLDQVDKVAASSVTLFVIVKSLGTLVVLLTVYTLIKRRGRIGHPIAVGVASFQLALATYLTFGGK
jgi:hypothetical protein